MNIKQLSLAAAVSALTFTTATNAVLGPIPIYLNTEYRTANPMIGSIASTIKLNKEQINATGANTFLELLAAIPSLNLEAAQGNVAAIRIRGNDARHALLLVDGIKVDQFGQPNLDVIPFDQIQRVEITKGPFSALYGSGAIGGVIHVFTNQESTQGEQGSINISYGTNNTKKVGLTASINNDNNYVNFSLSDYHTDGVDAKNDGDLDSIDRTTGSLNIGANIFDATNLKFGILTTDANVKYDPSSNWDPTHPESDKNLDQITTEINHQFSDTINSKLSYAQNKQTLYGNDYKTTDLSILNDIKLDNGLITTGITKQNDKNTTTGTHNSNLDLFGQWQGMLKDNELSVGLRHTNHNRFNTHTSYNLNWAKDLNSDVRVNASYGKATKLPSLSNTDTNIASGHTELTPETSNNIEFGVSKKYNDWSISGKFYKNKVTDYFSYNYGDDGFYSVDDYYENLGTYNIKGADLTLKNKFLDWNITTEYGFNNSVKGGTNYQTGRRPHHSLSFTGTKQIGKFNHRINLISKSKAWDTNSGTNEIEGYMLVNLSTSYDYNKDVTLAININNALDKKYEVAKGYNQLGQTINMGVTYKF